MPTDRREDHKRHEEDEDEEGLDLHAISELVGYVLRAPRRHPTRFLVLFVLAIGVGGALFVLYPRTYSTDVKILAQRNLVLPALGNPNRTVPREADNPTKNVGDTILQHDNLMGLIKQVNLVDRWDSSRPTVMRWKDRVTSRLAGPQDEKERMRAIEGVLEKRLVVTSDETTITITAEWSDPQMAYDIASAVEKNFIDARYDAEISVINDAIDILQQHASEEKSHFDEARNEFESVEMKQKPQKPPTNNVAPTPRVQAPPPKPSASAATAVDPALLQALQDKRTEIQQIEAQRTQRINELNRQISDALVQFKPEHPTVVALKQKLADAQAEPPDLARLRNEERALIDKVAVNAPPLATAIAAATTTHSSAATIAALTGSPSSPLIVEEDPAVTVARMKLQQAAQKYAELENRIDAAQIELDIAKTAHKYRFSIIHPAEVSKRPRKPNPIALFAGIAFAIFFFAFGGVLLRERRLGLIVEPWQVERKLKLPILGELET